MSPEEIISGLLDNARDRRSMVSKEEPDSIFAHDAQVMEQAVRLIRNQQEEIRRLRKRGNDEKEASN